LYFIFKDKLICELINFKKYFTLKCKFNDELKKIKNKNYNNLLMPKLNKKVFKTKIKEIF